MFTVRSDSMLYYIILFGTELKVVLTVLHTGVTQNVLAIVSNSLVLVMLPIIKVHGCLVRYHTDAYETQNIL